MKKKLIEVQNFRRIMKDPLNIPHSEIKPILGGIYLKNEPQEQTKRLLDLEDT